MKDNKRLTLEYLRGRGIACNDENRAWEAARIAFIVANKVVRETNREKTKKVTVDSKEGDFQVLLKHAFPLILAKKWRMQKNGGRRQLGIKRWP